MAERSLLSRILIVDDEPLVHAVLKRALAHRKDWQVVHVCSGAEALSLVLPESFDLIVVDKNMPAMTGDELIRRVREIDAAVGIVLMTGAGSLKTALEMLELDMDGSFEKPFDDLAELESLFEKTIEKSQQRAVSTGLSILPADSMTAPRAKSTRPPPSILLVSPLRSERQWIAARLPERRKLFEAASSRQALDQLHGELIDLLIVDADVAQPDVSELVQAVSEAIIGVQIMVVVRTASANEVQRLMALDIAAVVQKPLDDAAFRQHIARLLEPSAAPPVPALRPFPALARA